MASRNGRSGARRQRRTQKERRAETSGRLIRATIDLLLEKGYSGFRIADAAKKAKVSRGGQTHHFATKNEMIEAAIGTLFDGEVGQAQADAANCADEEMVRRAAQHADAFLSSKLYQVSLNMLISAKEHEDLAEGVRAISAGGRAPIEEAWISRLGQSGVSREDAETVLGLLWSVQRGLSVEGRIGGDPSGIGSSAHDAVIELLDDYLRERKPDQPA